MSETTLSGYVADALARTYDGQPLTDLRDEHAELHREAAGAVLSALGTDVEIGSFRVVLLPAGHPMRDFSAITVRLCSSGRWQVDRLGFLLDAAGRWEQGTKRSPEWRAEREFSLSEAVRLARAAAPSVAIDGSTVGAILSATP
jgi:hypothetical protein